MYDINAQYDGKSEEVSFRYSVIHGDESCFKIHFETGKITTLKKLDRELTAKYTVSFIQRNLFQVASTIILNSCKVT